MANNKPSRKTNKVNSFDKITLKTGRKGTDEVEISIADFSENIGTSGESTPAVYYVEKTDNYELKRSVSSSGEFEIQVRYKVGYESDFTVNLFDTEPAHIYYDRYIDVVEVNGGGSPQSGSWELDRFFNNEVGITNSLQGSSRSQGEVYVDSTAIGTEVYYNSNKIIDITSVPSSLSFTSAISNEATPDAYRIVSFRGVMIKDKLGL